jgi:hypothetical protein
LRSSIDSCRRRPIRLCGRLASLPGQDASADLLLDLACPLLFSCINIRRSTLVFSLVAANGSGAKDSTKQIPCDDKNPEYELKMINDPLHGNASLRGLFGFSV